MSGDVEIEAVGNGFYSERLKSGLSKLHIKIRSAVEVQPQTFDIIMRC